MNPLLRHSLLQSDQGTKNESIHPQKCTQNLYFHLLCLFPREHSLSRKQPTAALPEAQLCIQQDKEACPLNALHSGGSVVLDYQDA